MPDFTALTTLAVEACGADGTVIAQNFVHYFVSSGYPPAREELPRLLVIRGTPPDWTASEWSGGAIDRERERAEDACFGHGHGYFEWLLPLGDADLVKARRLRVLCEASSRRVDSPQTDDDIFPTNFEMLVNGVRVYEAMLRNHPHDARGVLSYLRGGKGAYGYLAHAFAEGPLLRRIVGGQAGDRLRLRCAVPKKS
ncbi:MAG: glycoside hydrolase family 2, partial [Verrucomicrobia subdivision 3 bacterium]|nr:glycoside hydrolase family 2 [Limisphaerales bacterium]